MWIIKTISDSLILSAIMDAIKKWEYAPAKRRKKPVSVWISKVFKIRRKKE